MLYNRKTKELLEEPTTSSLNILYSTFLGRILLKLITKSFFSNIIGIYMKSGLSRFRINKFIKKNSINMQEYDAQKYKNFDQFFIRKIKQDKRPIDDHFDNLIAPCDSRLLVYKIDDDLKINIKNSIYTISELLQDNELASKYKNGYCMVFRLCVDDYHHYHYIDDGISVYYKKIKGIFHTVQPIAFKKYKVFSENNREYDLLKTKNFGDIIQMEIGALGVGKIVNLNKKKFIRGEEKGYFRFGGSTIVLLISENRVIIDQDIMINSLNDIETKVFLNEIIGKKLM